MNKTAIRLINVALLFGMLTACANSDPYKRFVATEDDINTLDNDKSKDVKVFAWNCPTLDPTNHYDNTKNDQIALDMKEAGVDVIILSRKPNNLYPNSEENIRTIKDMIALFNKHDIQSVAFGGNAGNRNSEYNKYIDDLPYPDFSKDEGFYGFLPWDEPTSQDIMSNTLRKYAIKFNELYRGTDKVYMNNLLPSYGGPQFKADFPEFEQYLKYYCDQVLSAVEGEKWISLDTYPILKDRRLQVEFLYDIMALKKYAMYAEATSHICIQTGGWHGWSGSEISSDGKSRLPTEEEVRLQVYSVLSLGIDQYSLYTYAPSFREEDGLAVVTQDGEKDLGYQGVKNVNAEVSAFEHIYRQLEWKGYYLNSNLDSKFGLLANAFKDYRKTLNNIKTIESIQNLSLIHI